MKDGWKGNMCSLNENSIYYYFHIASLNMSNLRSYIWNSGYKISSLIDTVNQNVQSLFGKGK